MGPEFHDALNLSAVFQRGVFPLDAKKRPLTRHGFKDATDDEDELEKMFLNPAVALVGVPTGDGIVAVDIDKKGGKDGSQWPHLYELPQFTRKHRTPTGGEHWLYRVPDGVTVPNSASQIFDGLDIRGDGGYVASGDGYHVLLDEDLAELTHEQVALITRTQSKVTNLAASLGLNGNSEHLQALTNGTAWHEPMLKLTASYVAKGLAREEIISLLLPCRWDGYSEAETRAELGKMIDGAQAKDWAPEVPPDAKLRTLTGLFNEKIETREALHPFLPPLCSLLVATPKTGKSLLLESTCLTVAKTHRVLFCALEYSVPMAQARFKRHFEDADVRENLRLLIEGDIPKMDQGGAEQLQRHLDDFEPALVVIDTLSRLKRPGAERGYEAETDAMTEIKTMVGQTGADCVMVHHARKKSINDSDDIFERSLGSTALNAVPDNLMMLEMVEGIATLHTKGRLIMPQQKRLELRDGEFFELTEPGAQLVGKADRQAEILNLLGDGAATQTQIAAALNMDAANVSRYCAKLEQQRRIKRDGRGQPWRLTDAEVYLDV